MVIKKEQEKKGRFNFMYAPNIQLIGSRVSLKLDGFLPELSLVPLLPYFIAI